MKVYADEYAELAIPITREQLVSWAKDAAPREMELIEEFNAYVRGERPRPAWLGPDQDIELAPVDIINRS